MRKLFLLWNLARCFIKQTSTVTLVIVLPLTIKAQLKFSYDASGNRILSEQKESLLDKPQINMVNDSILSTTASNYYQWYFNNNEINDATNQSIKVTQVGFYKVAASPNKLCWGYSNDFPIIVISTPLPDTISMVVYPNPSSGRFSTRIQLKNATGAWAILSVFNQLGMQVYQTQKLIFFNDQILIPVTLSASGTYSVSVNINGDLRTQQLIIVK